MSTNPNLLPTSKMTRSVIDAFKGLNVGSAQDVSDHEAIYEVSYQYLSKVKQFKDLEAFHNCLVSLINTDKYYKALTLINEVPAEIHQEYPLEKAYVYYKTGNTDLLKALYDTTVASSGLSEVLLRAMKHVMAQSCYQNGEVTHALKLYHELISSNAIDSQIDLACNERAILSQVLFKTSSSQKPLLNLANADDSYDFIFNNALIELAKGNLAGSLDLLNSALDLCKTQNMDSDPADLALESTPIKLTIAYIYQVTGREQKAIDVLENLDLADTADLMLQLIVKNNLISVQPAVDNVNYSSRELNYHHNLHHLRSKLTKSQSKVLLKNHLLLSYQTNTLSKSSTYVSNRFIKQFITESEGDYTPLVYKVLLKLDVTFEDIENPETNRAISRKLLKFANAELEKNVASDILVAAALLLVALNSKVSKFDQSTLVLEKLVAIELAASDAPLHGSIFKAIIEVYELSNSAKKLSELYTAIVTKFKSLSVETIRGNDNLYKFILAVAVKLSTVDLEAESAELLNLLLTVKESEVVASILNSNADGLLSVQELESEADVETLLAVNVEELAPKLPVPKAKKIKQADFKVKKKTTKPKFSENKFFKPASEFDPEKDLDREKWLPMKLRSYYKPSKKELKKKSGGHQGAIESSPAPQVAQQVSSSSKSKKTKKKKGKK